MSRQVFKMYSCGLNAGTDTSVSLANAIVSNVLLHSNSHISQVLPQIIHIPPFCLVDLLIQIL